MAKLNYTDQLNFTGAGYIDAKMQPVETVADLNKIPRSQRFVGLTVTVLDDGSGKPFDYWLETSVTKWVKKIMPTEGEINIQIKGDDIETL